MKRMVFLGVLFLIQFFGIACLSWAGPISQLYVTTTLGTDSVRVVQGSSVVNSWAMQNSGEFALAVNSTVRTMGASPGRDGSQYTLAGAFIGPRYRNNTGESIFDGATDGTFNYAVGFSTGTVYRFNLDWTAPVALFSAGGGTQNQVIGITYDPINSSLWISDWTGSQVKNYTLGGALLGQFSTGHANNVGLAMDYADGTLWLATDTQLGIFEQYSRAGTHLSTQYYSSLGNQSVRGAEFQFVPAPTVPEPASMTLVVVGAAGLIGYALRRRRIRKVD